MQFKLDFPPLAGCGASETEHHDCPLGKKGRTIALQGQGWQETPKAPPLFWSESYWFGYKELCPEDDLELGQ